MFEVLQINAQYVDVSKGCNCSCSCSTCNCSSLDSTMGSAGRAASGASGNSIGEAIDPPKLMPNL